MVGALLALAVRARAGARGTISGNLDPTPDDAAVMAEFGLSPLGFLPATCVRRLPQSHDAWEQLSAALPALQRRGSAALATAVATLPVLDVPASWNDAQRQRAWVLLGQLVASVVNSADAHWCSLTPGDMLTPADLVVTPAPPPPPPPPQPPSAAGVPEVTAAANPPLLRVPSSLSVPFDALCAHFGLPRILTAGLDLWNWMPRDDAAMDAADAAAAAWERQQSGDAPLWAPTVRNATCISTVTGSRAEVGFHLIPCAMHAVAGRGRLLLRLYESPRWMTRAAAVAPTGAAVSDAAADDVALALGMLTRLLHDVGAAVREFRAIFQNVGTMVDVDVFYNVYRPLLGGWFPRGGVVFEGVAAAAGSHGAAGAGVVGGGGAQVQPAEAAGGVLHDCKGPSAGQSTMVLLFDMLLGVRHHSDGAAFQSEMLEYMPARHRNFVVKFTERLCAVTREMGDMGSGASTACATTALPLLMERLTAHPSTSGGTGLAGLVAAHKECLEAMASLRKYHLGIATKYLVRTSKGTGSSDFRDMLREVLDDTTRTRGKCPF